MCIKLLNRNRRKAVTFVEIMVATAIFGLLGLAMLSLYSFSFRSFTALLNYSELDQNNRQAMDQMTRDIRQAQRVTAFNTNSITLIDGTGSTLTYSFDPNAKTMIQTRDGVSTVLLEDCSLLDFGIYQRNPVGGSYDVYPVATPDTTKVIQLTWKTSRTVLDTVNSENVQTARIVIRKQ